MSIRDTIGQTILELAHQDKRIVVLTADLGVTLRVEEFKKAYPERFFEVGVAEQNLAGVGAGLALAGKIPFLMSFAVFNPGLNLAMIRTIAYSNLNVKIVGGHAGLSNHGDGATHQALEDIAIMRTLPNMTVLSPADEVDARWAIKQATKIPGPVYIRSTRLETPTLKHTDNLKLGKLELVYSSNSHHSESTHTHPEPARRHSEPARSRFAPADAGGLGSESQNSITLIATGVMTHPAIKAAQTLSRKGLNAQVFNAPSIKPIDKEKIRKLFLESQLVVTLEDHQVAGGLGGLVAEIASSITQPHAPLFRIGVKDSFGQSARSAEELYKAYGLDKEGIVKQIVEFSSSVLF